MTKIKSSEVDKIMEIKKQLTDLYEEQDILFLKLFGKYGEGVFYVPRDGEEYPFLKITIRDNVKDLKEKGKLWKSTMFQAVSVDTLPVKKEGKTEED